MPLAGMVSSCSSLPRISAAALLVKVTARILYGDSSSLWISQAILWISTRVLPLPAPARIRELPGGAATASRCRSFRESRRWETSMVIRQLPTWPGFLAGQRPCLYKLQHDRPIVAQGLCKRWEISMRSKKELLVP